MKAGDVVVGRFELDRAMGSGGMGEVWRAVDRTTGDIVAVKGLLERRRPPEDTGPAANAASNERSDAARFTREAKVLAELRHPRIVRYIAHGVTPAGEPYLVMEWLEGEHLLSRLVRQRLTIDESVALAGRVAEALGAAHAHGIVHRDLKPTNLLLENRRLDRVKLLDFGIAHLNDMTRMTRTGALLGTPGYMAPEQARSGQIIDARADVFALGCVLFECLTGAPAFKGDHIMSILAKILFEEAPRVREVRPEVPADLDALVAHMLAKDPNERPRDGAAVQAALASLGKKTGVIDLAPASAPTSATAVALTRGERRALSVVLMGRRAAIAFEAQTLDAGCVPNATLSLQREAEACGGRLEHLADGSVVVTITDARMATDQAAQAARCALALHKLAQGRLLAVATGYGKVTGRMPVGAAIDRAAAMLARRAAQVRTGDEAPPIAIDDVTAGLLDDRFEVQSTADGLTLHPGRELAEGTRTLLGKPTRCVGRDWEIGALKQILTECVEESVARAVLVTAPAGMGKSRVAHELLRMVRQGGDLLVAGEPIAIWMARGDSLRAGSAFGLLAEALRSACGLREGEPLPVRREKLAARVAEHVPASEARRVTAFLGELIGTPLEDDDDRDLYTGRRDAQRMGDHMRRAFEDFLAAECAARPVLLVLEDLHWGDLPTVRFIDGALRSQRHRSWMVLALARPEVHDLFPKLWAERGLQEIRLKELTRRASERLVREVLGDRVGQDTVERLAAQSDGNAFYLEELIRAVAERRGEALPETVVAMVQSRLAGLELEARRVLRAASVFGEVFWPGGVLALLGGAKRAADVTARLGALVDREALVRRSESRFPGEEELGFRHALLREGAYAMLTEEDRALGHRLAGEWLLSHGEGDPIVLAEHFERGQELERAGRYYLAAVDQAHRGGDTATAIARARRALACGIPEHQRLALLGMLCVSYVYRPGSLSEAEPYIEEVIRKTEPGSAPWAQAASAKLVSALHLDKHEMFAETLYRVMQLEPAPDAALPVIVTLLNGIYILDAWGHIEDANAILERMHAIVDTISAQDPLASGFLNAIHALRDGYTKEDPWSAWKRAEVSKAQFIQINHHRGIANSQVYAGINLWCLGALGRAEQELRGVESGDDELGSIHRSMSLVFVLAERGALAEAAVVAARLVESAHARRHRMDEGRGRWATAEVLRRQGDLDAAEREARAALELLATAQLDRTAAAATLAAILLAQRRAAEGLAVAQDAMARYAAMRACGFFRGAFLRLVHAECLWATGDNTAARAAIESARERLLDNAEKIDDPEFKKSFLRNVPENARTLKLAREWRGEGGG